MPRRARSRPGCGHGAPAGRRQEPFARAADPMAASIPRSRHVRCRRLSPQGRRQDRVDAGHRTWQARQQYQHTRPPGPWWGGIVRSSPSTAGRLTEVVSIRVETSCAPAEAKSAAFMGLRLLIYEHEHASRMIPNAEPYTEQLRIAWSRGGLQSCRESITTVIFSPYQRAYRRPQSPRTPPHQQTTDWTATAAAPTGDSRTPFWRPHGARHPSSDHP